MGETKETKHYDPDPGLFGVQTKRSTRDTP